MHDQVIDPSFLVSDLSHDDTQLQQLKLLTPSAAPLPLERRLWSYSKDKTTIFAIMISLRITAWAISMISNLSMVYYWRSVLVTALMYYFCLASHLSQAFTIDNHWTTARTREYGLLWHHKSDESGVMRCLCFVWFPLLISVMGTSKLDIAPQTWSPVLGSFISAPGLARWASKVYRLISTHASRLQTVNDPTRKHYMPHQMYHSMPPNAS